MRRLAALTTASILALALAPAAPALAAPGPDLPLREAAARAVLDAPTGEAAGDAVDRRRQVMLDPAGDARANRGPGQPAVPDWQLRLADLRRISYTTPTAEDGEIRIRADWTQLRSPRAERAQRLFTYIFDPATEDLWALFATSRGRAFVLAFDEQGSEVRPDLLEVETMPGAGGRMEVRLSTEWLDAPVVRFASFTSMARASDDSLPTRRLQVGPQD